MLEDIEGLVYRPESLSEGLTSSQAEYLAELNMNDLDWVECNDLQHETLLSHIDCRMEEIGIDVSQRSEVAHSVYSDDLADTYDDYIVEHYNNDGSERIE
ncbi:MAG: hypothetical protein K2N91_06000, partial [Muribaculaceae bacterium]|nr:hypothetical protein [Muribaculaceae bacterium]